MVVLKKCGSSLADLHNTRGFESKILCTLTFGMHGKHSVSHIPSCYFEVKTTYFYLVFITLVFCQGYGGIPGRFREVPRGSG